MVRKITFAESKKPHEKKEYFDTKYSFKAVTGMSEIGDEAYIILLKPENMYQTEYHTVREKISGRVGFKGIFDTKIICKGFDSEGSRTEEVPLCCQYADMLFKQAKEKATEEAKAKGLDITKKDNIKFTAPISFTSSIIYIPVIYLGTSETDPSAKISMSKLSAKKAMFTYLEINRKTYIAEIVDALRTQLINEGKLDESLEGEELDATMLKKLKTHIIKVTASQPKGNVPYEKIYSFIPFGNKNIGSASGEYEDIVHYNKNKELMDKAVDFLSLFELEIDKKIKDWTDDELTKYLIEDEERVANIKAFNTSQPKEVKVVEEEKIEIIEDEVEEISVVNAPVVATVATIDLVEEDITFDSTEDSFDDWDDVEE